MMITSHIRFLIEKETYFETILFLDYILKKMYFSHQKIMREKMEFVGYVDNEMSNANQF